MDHLPHRNLYTRIKASAKGVGLFAIRDIPQGTKLFVGDLCPTVRIPFSEVAGIADPLVRQMYIDFCPLVGEHFLAPQDFNQMTMSWYLNHSDTPNVVVTPDLQFTTSQFVASGPNSPRTIGPTAIMPGNISPAGKELSRRLGDEVGVPAKGTIKREAEVLVRRGSALRWAKVTKNDISP